MDIERLIEANRQIADRSAKMRLRRAGLPRLLRNWLRNSDGEAECQEQIIENQNQLFQLLNAELSKIKERNLLPDIFLVHSLPKVGGTTIAATLSATFQEATVIHLHCLSNEGRRKLSMELVGCQKQSDRASMVEQLRLAQRATMLLEAGKMLSSTTQKRAIVCGIREPISWALSLYFHSFTVLFGRGYHEITVEMATDFIVRVLANEMRGLGAPFTTPEKWLIEEFASSHNFDIFNQNFNVEQGYQVYQSGKAPVLMIRQENLSLLSEALSLLLDYPKELFATANQNIGESKAYSDSYRRIRDKLRFKDDFLQSIYSSRYSQKFYSESERESFICRWKA